MVDLDRAARTTRAELGVGLAAVGRPAYLTGGRALDLGEDRSVEALAGRTAEVLDAAYAAGIRYVDAARSYGLAEEFLARWLRARPDADDVVVASKWGYEYVGGWRTSVDGPHEVKDHSLAAFERQLGESERILGARLGVYQIHSLTPDSPALADTALQAALGRLRDRGVRVGFSTSGPQQADVVRRALDIAVDGRPLFEVVQSTWNLLEPSAGPALEEAAGRGLDVVIKECLANGRLTDDETDPEAAPVARAARDLGIGLDQLAFAHALALPWATRVLCGAVTARQVERAAAAVAMASDPPQLAPIAQDPDEYWGTRSRRPWA